MDIRINGKATEAELARAFPDNGAWLLSEEGMALRIDQVVCLYMVHDSYNSDMIQDYYHIYAKTHLGKKEKHDREFKLLSFKDKEKAGEVFIRLYEKLVALGA